MRVLHGGVLGQDQDRVTPEPRHVMADKQLVAEPAREDRADRQHEQRNGHHKRRFMDMRHHLGRGARLAVERHDQQPPAVERRQERRRTAKPESQVADRRVRGERRLEDHVLGIEAGEEREACQRQRADPHHRIGERDLLPDAAHVAKVLLVRQRVDHRSRTKEQQRLEEGVCRQVEHRRRIGRHAGRKEHVAKLRAGRIGDHPLDIELGETDRCRKDRCHRADHRDDVQRQRRIFQHRR